MDEIAMKEILEAIWREFWEQPGVPVFPGYFEEFVRCKKIFCAVALARLAHLGLIDRVYQEVQNE